MPTLRASASPGSPRGRPGKRARATHPLRAQSRARLWAALGAASAGPACALAAPGKREPGDLRFKGNQERQRAGPRLAEQASRTSPRPRGAGARSPGGPRGADFFLPGGPGRLLRTDRIPGKRPEIPAGSHLSRFIFKRRRTQPVTVSHRGSVNRLPALRAADLERGSSPRPLPRSPAAAGPQRLPSAPRGDTRACGAGTDTGSLRMGHVGEGWSRVTGPTTSSMRSYWLQFQSRNFTRGRWACSWAHHSVPRQREFSRLKILKGLYTGSVSSVPKRRAERADFCKSD